MCEDCTIGDEPVEFNSAARSKMCGFRGRNAEKERRRIAPRPLGAVHQNEKVNNSTTISVKRNDDMTIFNLFSYSSAI